MIRIAVPRLRDLEDFVRVQNVARRVWRISVCPLPSTADLQTDTPEG